MADFEPDPDIVRFGAFTLDTRRRDLSRNGRSVELDARAFDLLAFLIARRAEPVSRDDILKHVWKELRVDPSNVAVQLSKLRGALQRAGCAEKLILTLPGQMYRFVGDISAHGDIRVPTGVDGPSALAVESTLATVSSRPQTRTVLRTVIAGSGLAAALLLLFLVWFRPPWFVEAPPLGLSIVVLPFHNEGREQGKVDLANAITDDLASRLSYIPKSTVIARESAEIVKNKSPQQIGHDLQVRYILSGSLVPLGLRYHVMVHLTDAKSGALIWSPEGLEFEHVQDQELTLIDTIVQHIASALHVKLDQLESSRSLRDRPNNPGAVDLFFRARAILDIDDSPEGLRRAQGLLEEAAAAEKDFVDALAELGWTLLRKVQAVDDETEGVADSIEAHAVLSRAIELAPDNAKALAARARELLIENKYSESIAVALRARAIEPSSIEAHSMLVNCDWMLGRLESERTELDVIGRLNPEGLESKHRSVLLGNISMFEGRPEDAIVPLLDSISGDQDLKPGSDPVGRLQYAHLLLAAAYQMTGRHGLAAAEYNASATVRPNRSVWRFAAYLPRAVAVTSNAANVLAALHGAGMPEYSDGTVALASPDVPCGLDDYSPTPLALPGGNVLDDRDLDIALTASARPIVLDVGLGTASPLQAI